MLCKVAQKQVVAKGQFEVMESVVTRGQRGKNREFRR